MNNKQMTPEERKGCFDAFIEEYKDNGLISKQSIIISELKELIALFQKMCSMHGFNPEILVNREIVDVNKEGYTEEDFAEAVYTYLQMYKEILAEYMLHIEGDNQE